MTIPDDVRERLAAVQHEIWAHWMRHLFGVSAPQLDGSVVIPPARVERWQRQMNTPYVDLTDREQESDRHQADKILATLDVSAAPDVMTIPDDVRDIIRTTLEYYVEYWDENDTSMDNRYSTDAHADAEIVYAWLDAQPDAPIPDWTTAPPWAQWWAVDADGFACWYGVAPPFLPNASHAWDSEPEGRGESVGYINLPVGVDWRTTLRRRPEVTE
jgi:hypothetical protein